MTNLQRVAVVFGGFALVLALVVGTRDIGYTASIGGREYGGSVFDDRSRVTVECGSVFGPHDGGWRCGDERRASLIATAAFSLAGLACLAYAVVKRQSLVVMGDGGGAAKVTMPGSQ